MPKILYNGVEFDSEEERLFYIYCLELKEAGYIKKFTFHQDKFVLSNPVKYNWIKKLKTKRKKMESTLLREHIYTPDFWILWDAKAFGIFYLDHDGTTKLNNIPFVNNIDRNGNDIGSYIEIKPSFNVMNMVRVFSLNQKWMYQEHHIYIQKITPVSKKKCLFKNTFVPKKALFTKTGKKKKYNFNVKSLENYVNVLKGE